MTCPKEELHQAFEHDGYLRTDDRIVALVACLFLIFLAISLGVILLFIFMFR